MFAKTTVLFILLFLVIQARAASGRDSGLPIPTAPVLPPEEIHPSLCFKEEQIPELRERRNRSPYREWWNAIKDRALRESSRDFTRENDEKRSSAAKLLAFVGTIEDNSGYITKAKQVLLNMDVAGYSGKQTWIIESEPLKFYAEAYDMLQPFLTPAEDAEVRRKLADGARRWYEGRDSHGDWFSICKGNWALRPASALGSAALALSGHPEARQWLARSLSGINGQTSNTGAYWDMYTEGAESDLLELTSDGLWQEGPGYAEYAFRCFGGFMWHYRNVSGVDLFKPLRLWFDYYYKARLPNGLHPNVEDAHGLSGFVSNGRHGSLSGALGQEHGGVHVWAFNNSPPPRFGWSLSYVDLFLWFDDSIKPTPPKENPTVFLKASNVAIFRSDWDNNDPATRYFYLNGAPPALSHNHDDPGSYMLYAENSLLANFPGYSPRGWWAKSHKEWYVTAEAHNVVTADGEASGDPQMHNTIASGFCDFAELTATYESGAVISRNVSFLGKKYFVVADALYHNSTHNYSMKLHCRGTRTIAGNMVIWTSPNDRWSKGAQLVAFILPSFLGITEKSGKASLAGGHEETNNYVTVDVSAPFVNYLTILYPRSPAQPFPKVKDLSSPFVSAAVLALGGGLADTHILKSTSAAAKIGPITTDAGYTFTREVDGKLAWFMARDCTTFAYAGKNVMSATRPVTLALDVSSSTGWTGAVAEGFAGAGLKLFVPVDDVSSVTIAGLNIPSEMNAPPVAAGLQRFVPPDSAAEFPVDAVRLPFEKSGDNVSFMIAGAGKLTVSFGEDAAAAPGIISAPAVAVEAAASGGAVEPQQDFSAALAEARKLASAGGYEAAAELIEKEIAAAGKSEYLAALAAGFRAARDMKSWIIDGVSAGREELVYINLFGTKVRGRVISADEESLSVLVMTHEEKMDWKDLSTQTFFLLAQKYAQGKDGIPDDKAALLGLFSQSCDLSEPSPDK